MSKQLHTMRIIWGALLGAVLIYFGVLMAIAPNPSEKPDPVMLYALGGMALSVAIVSQVLPRKMYARAVAKLKLEVVEDQEGLLVVANPQQARSKAYKLFQAPFIVSLAMAEAVAMFGFVLGFTGFPIPHTIPFFMVGMTLIGFQFPTASKVFSPIEAHIGARLH